MSEKRKTAMQEHAQFIEDLDTLAYIDDQKRTDRVKQMLRKGKVNCFLHPDTFSEIDGKCNVHPNLSFKPTEAIEKYRLVFMEDITVDFNLPLITE